MIVFYSQDLILTTLDIYIQGGWALTSDSDYAWNSLWKLNTSKLALLYSYTTEMILLPNVLIIIVTWNLTLMNPFINVELPILTGHTMSVYGRKIIVIGGADKDQFYLNTTYIFSPGNFTTSSVNTY
jgi:hypothetical protein